MKAFQLKGSMVNSSLNKFILLFILSTWLGGCVASPVLPSTAAILTEPEVKHTLTVDDPASFTLYSYRYNNLTQELTKEACFVPLSRKVAAELDSLMLAELLHSDDFNPSYLNALVFELTVTEGTATINLDPQQFSDIDLSPLRSSEKADTRNRDNHDFDIWTTECEIYSIWATITQNCSAIDRVRILYGGEPYQTKQYRYQSEPLLDDGGYFHDVPLLLPSYTTEELEALRQQVPYRSRKTYNEGYTIFDIWPPLIYSDPSAIEIACFLLDTSARYLPEKSFNKIEDANPSFILDTALWCAERTRFELAPIPESVIPDLTPLQYTTRNVNGKLKDHVEQAAREYFGEGVSVHHQFSRGVPAHYRGQGSAFRYDEYGGVYTLIAPVESGGIYVIPIITDLQEFDDRYEVSAVFLLLDYDQGYRDLAGNLLSQDQVASYCHDVAPLHRIILKKTSDGNLNYYAHILPEEKES